MTVSVDAVVYFNVIDSEQALCSVDDFRYYYYQCNHCYKHFAVLMILGTIIISVIIDIRI